MGETNQIPLSGDTEDIAHWMWKNLVPKSGQCESVQGELLRCVERLRWEAQTNGNINWDSGFETFVDYLDETLTGEPEFESATKREVRADLRVLRNYESPYLRDDLYDRLTECVIKFARLHPCLIPKANNADLHR